MFASVLLLAGLTGATFTPPTALKKELPNFKLLKIKVCL
ncbi:hypothetical protein M23134_07317 [Microscilla marina ATCC 23134]|uniref:Uncharacterized protein n=1 Tax=Microscilla marina ATCC 23134 TaxID=313606 RepID=A1ZVG8_MICM2|nr:hypothetical protein M23134_07317 [Microscilla marina ATCC 23134]